MKFSTINKLAHELKNEFKSLTPDWTVDEAVHYLGRISDDKEIRTKKQAAAEIYREFCENINGEEYDEEISLQEFVSRV